MTEAIGEDYSSDNDIVVDRTDVFVDVVNLVKYILRRGGTTMGVTTSMEKGSNRSPAGFNIHFPFCCRYCCENEFFERDQETLFCDCDSES
jgi:hypothetical protein